jgi:hypothetical protein
MQIPTRWRERARRMVSARCQSRAAKTNPWQSCNRVQRSHRINRPAEACDRPHGRHEKTMRLDITSFQSVAAGLPVEGEVCDLPHSMLWRQAGTDPEMAPLIQKLAATSIAEIERLIAALREARDHLQSERERIEQEMVRYMRLTEMASTTAKIISDAVSSGAPPAIPRSRPRSNPRRVRRIVNAVAPVSKRLTQLKRTGGRTERWVRSQRAERLALPADYYSSCSTRGPCVGRPAPFRHDRPKSPSLSLIIH